MIFLFVKFHYGFIKTAYQFISIIVTSLCQYLEYTFNSSKLKAIYQPTQTPKNAYYYSDHFYFSYDLLQNLKTSLFNYDFAFVCFY